MAGKLFQGLVKKFEEEPKLVFGPLIIFTLFAVIYAFGMPTQWCLGSCGDAPVPEFREGPGIRVHDLTVYQGIDDGKDIVRAEFRVKNELGIPYNLTVEWADGENAYPGMSEWSTETYPASQVENSYWVAIYPHIKGEWGVEVTIAFTTNRTYTTHYREAFMVE